MLHMRGCASEEFKIRGTVCQWTLWQPIGASFAGASTLGIPDAIGKRIAKGEENDEFTGGFA